MPGMDGTGPRGLGPGTGWGRGPCVRGLRPRFRMFWRRIEPITKEEAVLKEDLEVLESELKRIREKLKSLESEK